MPEVEVADEKIVEDEEPVKDEGGDDDVPVACDVVGAPLRRYTFINQVPPHNSLC